METKTTATMLKRVWAFDVRDTRKITKLDGSEDTVSQLNTCYAVGDSERLAIEDLARKRQCEAVAYSTGILGGAGGWILVIENGKSLWVSRGKELPFNPPQDGEAK